MPWTEKSNGLPWEREGSAGAPRVGICLSGGGIRAAAFGLGALQALQETQGLIYGPSSAELLAAVSGGSYVAGMFTLNAARIEESQAQRLAPLSRGSPESEHVLRHGRYLLDGGLPAAAFRFGGAGLVNFIVFVAIALWAGVMLADYAWIAEDHRVRVLSGRWAYAAAVFMILGAVLLVRGVYRDGGPGRYLYPLAGLLVILATSPSYIAAMEKFPPLSDLNWWWSLSGLGVAAAALVVIFSWLGAARIDPRSWVARALG